jgi:hypothetical protein
MFVSASTDTTSSAYRTLEFDAFEPTRTDSVDPESAAMDDDEPGGGGEG